METKNWIKVLTQAGLIAEDGKITAKPETILTINASGLEISVKFGSDEISVTTVDEILVVTNNATGFVQYVPWDAVTRVEHRRVDDHRYRHG